MSILLAIHSYAPGGNDVVARHWPFFKNAGADKIVGVAPETGGCVWPEEITELRIGDGLYLNGPNLDQRLVDTMDALQSFPYDTIYICEYDVLIFHPLPEVKGFAGHIAGGRTFDAPSSYFTHCPWAFDKETMTRMMWEGRKILGEETPAYGSTTSSPDIFLAWIAERLGIPCQTLWTEFSRNAFDCPGDIEKARLAYLEGVDVIHGCKTEDNLRKILNGI